MTRAPDPTEVRAAIGAVLSEYDHCRAMNLGGGAEKSRENRESFIDAVLAILASATEAPPVAGMGERRAVPDYRDNLARALFEATYGKTLIAWSDATRDFWLARADAALTKPTPPASVSGEVVVVPCEPTDDHFQQAFDAVTGEHETGERLMRAFWRAMLAAAPEAATPSAVGGEPMREALEPFAKEACVFDGTNFGDHEAAYNGTDITVGDLRRARAALATGETSPERGKGE